MSVIVHRIDVTTVADVVTAAEKLAAICGYCEARTDAGEQFGEVLRLAAGDPELMAEWGRSTTEEDGHQT